jgi:hypothetical protein
MKRLIEFPLEDGTSMLVEVDEPEQEGLERVSRHDPNVIERAQQTLEKSLDRVKPAAQYILEKLRELSDSPDEIEVQFGLKLNAGSGVILAAGVEANYTVKLKWVKGKS